MRNAAFRPVPLEERAETAEFSFGGIAMACDWTGCLFLFEERILVVSDLHLEKGATLASQGRLIPPYDTKATLRALQRQIGTWQPRAIVSLGDSFHDGEASGRMPEIFRDELKAMMRGREWVWIAGNHDPAPPAELGGTHCGELSVGPLTLRHEPASAARRSEHDARQPGLFEPDLAGSGFEISGHLHPVARIVRRGKAVRRRCFVSDGARMIMPSFGAFTGGLNIREPAFDGLFDEARLHAHLLGHGRVFTIAGNLLV
ncbi:MAG: ligase-associated DNA damage response endonuclease PdeM [Nitratireductor sp.]|nr:ligase-associated DNA damage response endonuclease PdeM [Nitratireductor sp.]